MLYDAESRNYGISCMISALFCIWNFHNKFYLWNFLLRSYVNFRFLGDRLSLHTKKNCMVYSLWRRWFSEWKLFVKPSQCAQLKPCCTVAFVNIYFVVACVVHVSRLHGGSNQEACLTNMALVVTSQGFGMLRFCITWRLVCLVYNT